MTILPTVFVCSTSSKQFIKLQAKLIIEFLEQFPINEVIIDILDNLCDNKNHKISELSS